MAHLKQDDIAAAKGPMRKMRFSSDAVGRLPSTATAGRTTAVAEMTAFEPEQRDRRKGERMVRKARFPRIKSFEGYDFSQVSFPEGYAVEDLKSLGFAEAAQDFVFHGQTDRGKTHLAIAIGMACAQQGGEARLFTAAELAMALVEASRGGCLKSPMRDMARAKILIVDELGYVPLDQEGARLLFQVLSDCCERRILVIAANIEFSGWGVVFGGDKMAQALIDRVMHHGRLVEFNAAAGEWSTRLCLAGIRIGQQEYRGSPVLQKMPKPDCRKCRHRLG